MTVVPFPARRSAPASPIERLEGLLDAARLELESDLPMTRAQRIKLAVMFENVLDQMESVLGMSPNDGAA